MMELITPGVITAVGATVAEYAFGRIGDKFFDTLSAKRKIKKILKDDRNFIENQFKNATPDLRLIVEEFLFKDIFQDSVFLYPVTNIPDDKAELLWKRFRDYVYKIRKEMSEIDTETEAKLRACINNHNELINKNLLSESERIILKTIHRNQSDLLGYIGKTLDENSELQFQDSKLDYTHKQIEGILHALRMDMRHYKFLLLLYSVGILIIGLVSIITLPKTFAVLSDPLTDQSIFALASIIFIVCSLLMLIFYLFSSSLSNVKNCEKRISAYMEALWELHFQYYRLQFENSFYSC